MTNEKASYIIGTICGFLAGFSIVSMCWIIYLTMR